MREDLCMYIDTDRLQNLFVKNDRLSITVDSLSNLNEGVINDIIKDIIDNNGFMKQDVIDTLLSNSKTKIIVKTIIMDEYLDGIYLVFEDIKSKITIPGGHVSEQDRRLEQTPMKLLELALCRELCEEYQGLMSVYESQVAKGNVTLTETLDRLGFEVIHSFNPMYLYNPNYINTLTVYYPIVVGNLSGIAHNDSIYLSKSDYEFNRDHRDLHQAFYEGIDNDIRFNEYSFILDFVFNTSIF